MVSITALKVLLNYTIKSNSKYLYYGIGFYALWLGVICIIAHAILYKGDKVRQSYTEPVQNMNNESNNVNEQIEDTTNNVKFCPSCGTKLDQNAQMCFMCGHKF